MKISETGTMWSQSMVWPPYFGMVFGTRYKSYDLKSICFFSFEEGRDLGVHMTSGVYWPCETGIANGGGFLTLQVNSYIDSPE